MSFYGEENLSPTISTSSSVSPSLTFGTLESLASTISTLSSVSPSLSFYGEENLYSTISTSSSVSPSLTIGTIESLDVNITSTSGITSDLTLDKKLHTTIIIESEVNSSLTMQYGLFVNIVSVSNIKKDFLYTDTPYRKRFEPIYKYIIPNLFALSTQFNIDFIIFTILSLQFITAMLFTITIFLSIMKH